MTKLVCPIRVIVKVMRGEGEKGVAHNVLNQKLDTERGLRKRTLILLPPWQIPTSVLIHTVNKNSNDIKNQQFFDQCFHIQHHILNSIEQLSRV